MLKVHTIVCIAGTRVAVGTAAAWHGMATKNELARAVNLKLNFETAVMDFETIEWTCYQRFMTLDFHAMLGISLQLSTANHRQIDGEAEHDMGALSCPTF
jgi:hypothetical protein